MSIMWCDKCDKAVDTDWDPMEECKVCQKYICQFCVSPYDNELGEFMCNDCYEETSPKIRIFSTDKN